MKKHIKPCNCETCEKARYLQPCSGCRDGHSSFWKSCIESPQWKLWEKEMERRMEIFNPKFPEVSKGWVFDIAECVECGYISQKHFQEFLKFCKNL